jgi:hypothetical protein
MDRLHHIQKTYIKNISDNIIHNSDNEVEFLLLDYNSSDNLEEWMSYNASEFIKSGIVKFYKYADAKY